MSNFIQQCLAHEAQCDDIDDFIQEWHQNPRGQQVYDFLGMTWQEYALWMVAPSVLPMIVEMHKKNKSLDEILEEFAHQLPGAAKSPGPGRTKVLADWLETYKPWQQPAVK